MVSTVLAVREKTKFSLKKYNGNENWRFWRFWRFPHHVPMYHKNPVRELIHCVESAPEQLVSKNNTTLGNARGGPQDPSLNPCLGKPRVCRHPRLFGETENWRPEAHKVAYHLSAHFCHVKPPSIAIWGQKNQAFHEDPVFSRFTNKCLEKETQTTKSVTSVCETATSAYLFLTRPSSTRSAPPLWAPVREPGFLDFQIFRLSIRKIVYFCKMFLNNMLVRYRRINHKGVLERPWTKWMFSRTISGTLKFQFTVKCWKVDFLMPCKTKSCQRSNSPIST